MPLARQIQTVITAASNGHVLDILNENEAPPKRNVRILCADFADAAKRHQEYLAGINPDDYPIKPAPPVPPVIKLNPIGPARTPAPPVD